MGEMNTFVDTATGQELAFDLAFPSVTAPAADFFAVADEASLRALVWRHHERLRASSIGYLFPAEPKRFAAVVEKISRFVVETIRGSTRFVQSHGPTWMRSQHLPITIDETTRNIWLAELLVSFDDVGFPEAARRAYWNWVEALSILVINRRTMIGQPRRYPFADAPNALRPFIHAQARR